MIVAIGISQTQRWYKFSVLPQAAKIHGLDRAQKTRKPKGDYKMNTLERLTHMVEEIRDELEGTEDIFGWINDKLSIESFFRSANGELQGAEILITCGGPDIRLDTRSEKITGHWGSDTVFRYVASDVCEEINALLDY